jgi:hypothetical protein
MPYKLAYYTFPGFDIQYSGTVIYRFNLNEKKLKKNRLNQVNMCVRLFLVSSYFTLPVPVTHQESLSTGWVVDLRNPRYMYPGIPD